MPDPNYTAIGIVLDESGSMSSHVQTAIDGYNELLDDQKRLDAGRATLTRTIFNHEYPPRTQHADLESAEPLSEATYDPGGRTALWDAVGHTIDEMGARFDAMDEDETPAHVLVAIITDGKENSSEEYSADQVRELIEQQEDEWGWEFIYLGAGVDDFADPDAMGLDDQQRTQQSKDEQGVQEAYDQAARAAANVRQKGAAGDYQEGGQLDFDDSDSED